MDSKGVVRYVPNALSVARIVMCIALLFMETMDIQFIIVYIISFVTDILDGNIARLTGNCTDLGKNLDSIGDFMLFVVVIFKIIPWLDLKLWAMIWILAIVIARLASNLLVYRRTKKYIFTHSVLNKVTSFLIFAVPFLVLAFGEYGLLFCLGVGTVNAVDELRRVNSTVEKYFASQNADVGN